MTCSICGYDINAEGGIVLQPVETRRINEIDGFIKGVPSGEAFAGERDALKAEWERIGQINMERASCHYGHILHRKRWPL